MFLSNISIAHGDATEVSEITDNISDIPLELCGLRNCFTSKEHWTELPLKVLREVVSGLGEELVAKSRVMLVTSNLEHIKYGTLKDFKYRLLDLGLKQDVEIVTFYECASLFKALDVVLKDKRSAIIVTLDSVTLDGLRFNDYAVYSDTSIGFYLAPDEVGFRPMYRLEGVLLKESREWGESLSPDLYFSTISKFRNDVYSLFGKDSNVVYTSLFLSFLVETSFADSALQLNQKFSIALEQWSHCRNADAFIQWEKLRTDKKAVLESVGNGFYGAALVGEL